MLPSLQPLLDHADANGRPRVLLHLSASARGCSAAQVGVWDSGLLAPHGLGKHCLCCAPAPFESQKLKGFAAAVADCVLYVLSRLFFKALQGTLFPYPTAAGTPVSQAVPWEIQGSQRDLCSGAYPRRSKDQATRTEERQCGAVCLTGLQLTGVSGHVAAGLLPRGWWGAQRGGHGHAMERGHPAGQAGQSALTVLLTRAGGRGGLSGGLQDETHERQPASPPAIRLQRARPQLPQLDVLAVSGQWAGQRPAVLPERSAHGQARQ